MNTIDNRHDVVIFGAGVDGGAMANPLAQVDARTLIVEPGNYLPHEPITGRSKQYSEVGNTLRKRLGVTRTDAPKLSPAKRKVIEWKEKKRLEIC